NFKSRRAIDRGHDAKRQPLGLKPRALLDMRFDEGGDAGPAERPRPLRIAAEAYERVAHQDAVRVLLVENVFRIVSSKRARAGEGRAKTDALLIAEGHDLDRVVKALVAPAQALNDPQRRQRAIISVVPSGVAHRVDVRAKHERRSACPSALIARHDIAGRVDFRFEPRLAAPADEGVRRAPMRLRQEKPRQPPRIVGELRERLEPGHEPQAGRALRVRYAGVHQFCAVSRPSQRARTLRSSSVIWLKLLGGMAWLRTACCRMAGAKRAICSGVSRSTPFGASPISSIGSGAWHIMQRSCTMSTTSGGAFGSSRLAVSVGRSANPISERMPGDAVAAKPNAQRTAAAAAAHAHQGARS